MLGPPFSNLEPDSFTASAASPVVDPGTFEGIRIAVPPTIDPRTDSWIPVCGTYVFKWPWYRKFVHISDAFVFLVRNCQTHQCASGTFAFDDIDAPDDGFGEAPPEAEAVADDQPDLRSQAWFNFDLRRVCSLVTTPAKYRLTIVLDEFQSNDVEFEVVETEP